MKKSSDGKAVKRSTAMNCLLVNQFATPGLGSIMGRRYIEGAVQLLLAVAGFVLLLAAFVRWIWAMMNSYGGTAGPFPWYGKIGGILFGASWFLSWITSVSLLRNSRDVPPEEIKPVPPKLDGR